MSARGQEIIFESDGANGSTISKDFVNAPSTLPSALTEGLDSSSLNPGFSFEVFQGKVFQTSRQGFNSHVFSSVVWFTLRCVEYSLADNIERRIESPMQRFTRIRAELSELKSDLDALVAFFFLILLF